GWQRGYLLRRESPGNLMECPAVSPAPAFAGRPSRASQQGHPMPLRPLPLFALACLLPLATCAATPEIIKPYPQANEGQQRHVIEVPPQANEADYRVELIAGKTLDVDCNQQHLAGQWQRKSVQGWGY